MKLVTSQQMRELDRAAIEGHGISSLDLMERAGKGLADAAVRARRGEGPVVVFAGRGNNGGDGLVAARHLLKLGCQVLTLIFAEKSELSTDARANHRRLARMKARIAHVTDEQAMDGIMAESKGASCAIDALLGTGLEREVTGLYAGAITVLNSLLCPVIAADVPSGLSADTGMPMGSAVIAQATVTFGLPKIGLFINKGPDHSGRVEVVDIGIPEDEVAKIESRAEMIEPSMFVAHFPKRRRTGHKGTYGHVAVLAGSKGHLGAGYLASLAALRAGCGLITYCVPEAAFAKFDARYPEIMCDPLPDDGKGYFTPSGLARALELSKKMDAVAIGPAIGTDMQTRAFVNALLHEVQSPVVVDADGLNVLGIDSLKGRAFPTILTPHPGEMAHMQGMQASEVQADRLGSAKKLALRTGAFVVLKGAATVVAGPDGSVAINPTGNPGMASAGMGDALTGIIASFLAQGMDARTACIAAVYLHGSAGDIAAEDFGEASVMATDVIDRLGLAIARSREL